jgi:phosphoglycerate dehydrogenase-like enzyme
MRWAVASYSAQGLTCSRRSRRSPAKPLFRPDQVVGTPHTAGSVIDLVADTARHAFTNMQSVLRGTLLPPDDVVVLPHEERK